MQFDDGRDESKPQPGAGIMPGRVKPHETLHDAPPLVREFVAAARAADAFENAAANERLQHGLKMPRRQAMPRGQSFCGDWMPGSLHRHVDDCSYGKNSFARKQRHGAGKTSLERNCLTAAVITYNYWAV